jgi:GT2 family glycosyltransferase
METYSKISIVVPVYNGEKTISQCLDSLLQLNYPREYLEIIIVDNNSTDHTKDIIKEYPVQYLFEKKRSISQARNRGIKNSTGTYIAFTDGDCTVDKNWLHNLLRPLGDEGVGVAAGKLVSRNSQGLLEKYIQHRKFYCQYGQVYEIKTGLPWIATANVLFDRKVFDKIGLFDFPRFLEDVDIAARLLLEGYKIRYAPEACVFHRVQTSLVGFCAWRFGRGRSIPCLHVRYGRLIKRGFHAFFLKEIVTAVISVFASLGQFIRTAWSRNKQNTVFVALDIAWRMMHIAGYCCGWSEIALGITTIAPLDMNNKHGLLWWYEGHSLVIIDASNTPPTHQYITGSGKRIWELLVIHGKTPDEIVGTLAEEYEEDPIVIKADVEAFLEKLKKNNLLKR